jgi:hypothetical protein
VFLFILTNLLKYQLVSRKMKALFILFLVTLSYCQRESELVSNLFARAQSQKSYSIYGSAQYEIVWNAVSGGKRIGQVVSQPVYISGNSSFTCIAIDTNIPLDNTTYGTKDFGVYNVATSKVNAMSFTINDTSGIGGARIFCSANDIVTEGWYYAIYRLASVSDATGTATANDSCGVLGGDNTTCCYNTSCNSRGTCNEATGVCACEDGWSGDYCERVQSTCTNGTLNATTGFCVCDSGFMGPGCNIPSCSGNGYWNSLTSDCVCKAGYGGTTCASCIASPVGQAALTFVCQRTSSATTPYKIMTLPTEDLGRLRSTYILPDTTDRDGNAYDCNCQLVTVTSSQRHNAHATHGHNQAKDGKKEKPNKHQSPVKSHSKHSRFISRALDGESESLPEFVNSLLIELGALTDQNTAILTGAVVGYIETRGISQNNGGGVLTIFIAIGTAFVTASMIALVFDVKRRK